MQIPALLRIVTVSILARRLVPQKNLLKMDARQHRRHPAHRLLLPAQQLLSQLLQLDLRRLSRLQLPASQRGPLHSAQRSKWATC